MRILTRYVAAEFVRALALCFGAFLILFLLVDVLERVDSFVERGAGLGTILAYFGYRVPELVFEMIPVSMLVATSVAVGRMTQQNEVTAMKAGGVSLYRAVVLPIVGIGVVVSFLCMGVNERLVPWTKARARQIIENVKARDRDPHREVKTPTLWFRGEREMVEVRDTFVDLNVLSGVTIYRLDEAFRPIGRLDADTARSIEGKWRFTNVVERDLVLGTVERHVVLDRAYPWTWVDLSVALVSSSTKEMDKLSQSKSYGELAAYVAQVEEKGYDPAPYRVELANKIAFPFVCLLVPLVAIPFALVPGRGAGVLRALALSVVVAVLYFFGHSLALAVGRAGRLPPLAAAWITNLLFALAGSYRLLGIRQ